MDNLWNLSGWWLNPTPLKNISSSIGMMAFPIYGKTKVMFQTTNHFWIRIPFDRDETHIVRPKQGGCMCMHGCRMIIHKTDFYEDHQAIPLLSIANWRLTSRDHSSVHMFQLVMAIVEASHRQIMESFHG